MKRFRNFAGGLSQERKEPDRRVGLIHASVILRSEEHTSELQSRLHLVCRLLLEKKKRSELLLNVGVGGNKSSYVVKPGVYDRGHTRTPTGVGGLRRRSDVGAELSDDPSSLHARA